MAGRPAGAPAGGGRGCAGESAKAEAVFRSSGGITKNEHEKVDKWQLHLSPAGGGGVRRILSLYIKDLPKTMTCYRLLSYAFLMMSLCYMIISYPVMLYAEEQLVLSAGNDWRSYELDDVFRTHSLCGNKSVVIDFGSGIRIANFRNSTIDEIKDTQNSFQLGCSSDGDLVFLAKKETKSSYNVYVYDRITKEKHYVFNSSNELCTLMNPLSPNGHYIKGDSTVYNKIFNGKRVVAQSVLPRFHDRNYGNSFWGYDDGIVYVNSDDYAQQQIIFYNTTGHIFQEVNYTAPGNYTATATPCWDAPNRLYILHGWYPPDDNALKLDNENMSFVSVCEATKENTIELHCNVFARIDADAISPLGHILHNKRNDDFYDLMMYHNNSDQYIARIRKGISGQYYDAFDISDDGDVISFQGSSSYKKGSDGMSGYQYLVVLFKEN